jgi:hypothetical protein
MNSLNSISTSFTVESYTWYSINIYLESDYSSIFNGRFSVNDKTNLIIGFYDNNNFGVNLLIPTGELL